MLATTATLTAALAEAQTALQAHREAADALRDGAPARIADAETDAANARQAAETDRERAVRQAAAAERGTARSAARGSSPAWTFAVTLSTTGRDAVRRLDAPAAVVKSSAACRRGGPRAEGPSSPAPSRAVPRKH